MSAGHLKNGSARLPVQDVKHSGRPPGALPCWSANLCASIPPLWPARPVAGRNCGMRDWQPIPSCRYPRQSLRAHENRLRWTLPRNSFRLFLAFAPLFGADATMKSTCPKLRLPPTRPPHDRLTAKLRTPVPTTCGEHRSLYPFWRALIFGSFLARDAARERAPDFALVSLGEPLEEHELWAILLPIFCTGPTWPFRK